MWHGHACSGKVRSFHAIEVTAANVPLVSAMVESDHVFGVDCDRSALEIAQENVNELELEDSVSLVHGMVGNDRPAFVKKSKYNRKQRGSKQPSSSQDVTTVEPSLFPFRTNSVDTVVCNPPFGTKRAGIDIEFLHVAWCVLDT